MPARDCFKSCCPSGLTGWIFLFVVATAACSAYLAGRETSKCDPQASAANLPESAAEMAVFLRGKLSGARIVSTRADGRIDRSFYLTVSRSDEDTLRRLPRVSERAEQWRGTVFCEWLVDWQPAELFLEEWGEHGFARPPFVFFGDKAILAKIQEALR